MLTMVSAQNAQNGTLLLPLLDSSGGYSVQDIQGLDPVKATLVSSSLAQMDGAEKHNARREPRNIIMKLGFEPDFVSNSVASLRSNLYDWFMPKNELVFGLYADGVLWGTTPATVESFENPMFTADPAVDISLICYDPDFYAPESTVLDLTTTNAENTVMVIYDGTSDTGVKFTFTFPAAGDSVSLYNTRPDGTSNQIGITGSFLQNDILTVNTVPGSKSITITRGGVIISVLYYLSSTPSWISLKKGINLFRAYYDGAASPYTLEYTKKFGGF